MMKEKIIIGDATFYHGDCLSLMDNVSDKSIDMILCDLPYGTTACAWDTIIPFELFWEQYKRIIKDNGAIVLTASQPFTSKLVMSNLAWFKYCWIWEKPQGTDFFAASKRPMNNYEDIAVFYLNQPTWNPIFKRGKPYTVTRDKYNRNHELTDTMLNKSTTKNKGIRHPKRIIQFKQEKELHPTQKPVSLFVYLIETYTNQGETVLNNCFGSGTTAIATYRTNRKFIGIEKEKKYFDIAIDRYRREIAQLRICDLK